MACAVICHTLGTPDVLRLEEVQSRRPGRGEVRVAVHAAGINFPDVLMTAGKYQLKPPLPFVPGMEAAGVIVEAGPGVAALRVGERVMFRAWTGCYAEETLVPEAELLPLPEPFGFIEGAAFMVATSTATNALLQRGQVGAGDVLLVHGAGGGVGLAAVEVGKLLGATVIAVASSEEKLNRARERGAAHVIDSTRESFRDRVLEITAGEGADVIFDPVGGDVFEQSMRCIAWGGRLLVVGFAGGRIGEVKLNQPLLKCFSIVGVRAIEHVARKPAEGAVYRAWMLDHARQGRLKPHVSAVLPLARFREALELIETRRAVGRVVLEVRPG
jgi:NADPH2:quinone reductase